MPTPEQMIENLWQYMRGAMQSLDTGGNITMAEIELKSKELCTFLGTLPPQEAKKFEPSLNELITYLHSITDKLEIYKDLLEDKIGMVNNRSIAHNAYGKAMAIKVE